MKNVPGSESAKQFNFVQMHHCAARNAGRAGEPINPFKG